MKDYDVPNYEADEEDPGHAEEPKAEPAAAEQVQEDGFVPIYFPGLEGRSAPARRFILEDWIPAECVTSLYGDGGIGKSLLAQEIATIVATGISAFGFK